MEPVTIKSYRRKYAVLLIIGTAFVAIAAFLPRGDANDWWRWPAGVFFGLGSLVFTILLVRPQRLLLDSRGLTVSGGLVLRPWTVSWSDIDHFTPMPTGMIGLTYRHGAGRESSPRRFNSAMSNVDGGIPGRWERSTPEMIALLEDYRSRALGRSADHWKVTEG